MKKILLILIVGIISKTSLAQLTVKNSAFIYANDVVLFVKDDVKLDATDDYIYLRDEAQLIQGTGTTGNSGVGKLSVYQTGTVDNYAYNYWGSPVGNTDTDDASNRAFRAGATGGNDGVMYYNVPSTNEITSSPASYYIGSANGYNGSPNLTIADYWLWSYNSGTAYSEWIPLRSTGELAAGYGYTMKGVTGGNQKYDFRGKPNTGTITVSVIKDKYTLVGNPYPSAIYANDFIWDTSNITNLNATLYFWEQDTNNTHYLEAYRGGYATYTNVTDGAVPSTTPATFKTYNGDGTINNGNVGTGTKTVLEYLPVGQGFMIFGDETGLVSFKNSMRFFKKESDGDSYFFRPASTEDNEPAPIITGRTESSETTPIPSENELDEHGHPIIKYNALGYNIVPSDYNRFRINIDFNDTYTRQLLQTFHNTATDGFDRGLESKSASSLTTDANWVIDDVAYVAQAFEFEMKLKIPLHVKIANPQTIRFRMFDIQNFEKVEAIYLHDIEKDFYFDLKTQNYEVFLDEGDYTNRFEITFVNQSSALGIDDDYASQLQLFQNNGQTEVTILNPNSLDIKNFKLYDINGRLILSKTKLEHKNKYTFNTSTLSTGIYIANIKLAESDILITKKIIIHD